MSRERLDDLLRCLEADGWVLLNLPHKYLMDFHDQVHWNFEDLRTGACINVDFHAFGDLGQRTNELKDIHYCVVRGHEIRLFFEKSESRCWRESLDRFTSAIQSLK